MVSGEAATPNKPAIKRGRTVTNLAANLANFAFGIFVGLWFTPYLIRKLGTASYGLIPLVSQITGYLIVVTILLNNVVGRYITVALEQHDHEQANHYFNTAFFGNICMVMFLVVPAILAAWNIESLINLPPGQETPVRWLFACTITAFFLATIQSPFGVAAFYTNRLDLQSAISLLQQMARAVLVVGFFSLLGPQVWHVGLAAMLSMCIGWGWSIRIWRRLTPMLRVSLSHFRLSALRSLLSTGGWLSLNAVGSILYLGIDLVVVNRLFGAESSGRYAVAAQWSGLLRSIATVMAVVFAPTIVYLYARNEIDELVIYTRRAVRFLGTAMALPIGLICGLSEPLLKTWLGPEFADLGWLMSLLTIHLSVNLAVQPLFNVQTATNRVRVPAIVTILMGAANCGLALFLAGPMRWGVYGVAAAGAIALTAKNLIFIPLYAAHVLQRSFGIFLREMLPLLLITLGTAATGKLVAAIWDVSGWLRLGVAGAMLSIIFGAVGYRFILSCEERIMALNGVRSYGCKLGIGRVQV
ncbi:MAG: oligosaccharide flippase family protein [Verrucomicrobiota bacterium]